MNESSSPKSQSGPTEKPGHPARLAAAGHGSAPGHASHAHGPKSPGRRRWVLWLLFAAGLAVGGFYGLRELRFYLAHESTDDAYVDGHVSQVLPRVSGPVLELLVADNQRVKAGEPLLRIDPRDFDLKVKSAEAALAEAQAELVSKQALANVARAMADADEISLHHAQDDFKRDGELSKSGALSDRDFATSKFNSELATSKHITQLKGVEAADAMVAQAKTLAEVRRSELDQAVLQQSYTTLVAPVEGVVSRRSVELGQYVQAGQPLMALATDTLWVVANFKETQIERMHPGQAVLIEADAYSGKVFHGHIDSLAAATGAKFALLPPDNAAGNFVKVTQRVPVKIVVDDADPAHPLRLGISVVASVVLDPQP